MKTSEAINTLLNHINEEGKNTPKEVTKAMVHLFGLEQKREVEEFGLRNNIKPLLIIQVAATTPTNKLHLIEDRIQEDNPNTVVIVHSGDLVEAKFIFP